MFTFGHILWCEKWLLLVFFLFPISIPAAASLATPPSWFEIGQWEKFIHNDFLWDTTASLLFLSIPFWYKIGWGDHISIHLKEKLFLSCKNKYSLWCQQIQIHSEQSHAVYLSSEQPVAPKFVIRCTLGIITVFKELSVKLL